MKAGAGLFSYIWRNSRRAQTKILCVVLLSFPFYYLSLDLPKYIISDALQGRAFPAGQETARLLHLELKLPDMLGGPRVILDGVWLDRLSYLFTLSGLFLLLILINGLFKYIINLRKGALGERLLQKLRLDLFSALLGFKSEQLQRIKPSEAATIIKDEVEPIGGFVGDAFIQPIFLGGQVLTALIFILAQNLALGLIALGMVLIQGAIIPRLRREQIRLGRQRQIVSRAFAGKIGEVVETLGEVSNHGTSAVERSLIAQRLEQLFSIRYRLFERKFAVKTLNNLLAQLTPFLYFAVGGYFALNGSLDLGQLVAVIAAYRDLPPPVKDLIDWDQQRLDVEAKFEQVIEHFSLDAEAPLPVTAGDAAAAPHLPDEGAIVAQGLTVTTATGDRVLDRVSLVMPLQRHVALSGDADEGAGILAQLIGGALGASEGSLTCGGMALSALTPEMRGRAIAYLGPEPVILDGSLRDNILYGLRRAEADPESPAGWSIDHGRADAADDAELALRLTEVLAVVGLSEAVFGLGLARKLELDTPAEVVRRIPEIRARIRARLSESGADFAIEPYDPERYTRNATIGENILFGVPVDPALVGASLASHARTRQVLDDLGLTDTLVAIGRRIAATMLEIFRDVTPGNVMFDQFSFIAAEEFQEYRDIIGRMEAGLGSLTDSTRLIGLSFLYVEPRHRLGLLDEALEQRILAARSLFHERASADPANAVAFYDPQSYCPAAPLRDNILFGQVAHGAVDDILRETLAELGLDGDVYRLGLDQPAGYSGRLLFPAMKAQVALARCLIKRPGLLVLNNALGAFGQAEARQILDRVRAAMTGRTLIVAGRDIGADQGYDLLIAFDGARLASQQPAAAEALASVTPDRTTTETDEIRILRAVPIFRDLDTARLKLLAFTSERTAFAPGVVLFRQGDVSDAAYVILSGTADVVVEAHGEVPVRMSSVGQNAIVGEMGLVTGDPRSATIIATSPIEALKLRKDIFLALLAEFPQMALSVMRLMVKRLQDNALATGRAERDEGEPGA